MQKIEKQLLLLLFAIITARLISLGLYALVDTTEARYAEMSRKILELNEWVTIYFYDYNTPFWGKPPLSFWASAITMKIFGINEFGARFAPFAATLATLYLFFFWRFDNKENSLKYKLGACIIFMSAAIGFVASGAVMTDMFLLFSITLSMIAFYKRIIELDSNVFWGYAFFIGLALGLLSKGPLVFVLVLLPIIIWVVITKNYLLVWKKLPIFSGTLLMLLIALPWYILAEIKTPGFLEYFILGEHIYRFIVSGWGGDLYGTAHSEKLGMIWAFGIYAFIPWSLVAIAFVLLSIKQKRFATSTKEFLIDDLKNNNAKNTFLILWILSPFIFFTFSKNILEAYTLPALFPFAIFLSSLIFKGGFSSKIWLLPTFIISLFYIFMIYPGIDSVATRHEKKLLSHWNRESKLYYVGISPAFSGWFYSNGKLTITKDMEDINNVVNNTEPQTLIMTDAFYREHPDLFKNYKISGSSEGKTIITNF